jgi:hypothetical protein
MTTSDRRTPPLNPDDWLYRRIEALERRLDDVENRAYPTLPLYDADNFPADPVEQQIVIAHGQPSSTTLAELGFTNSLGGSASTTRVLAIDFNNVFQHDGILVLTAAPVMPATATGPYTCTGVTDDAGDTFTLLGTADWGPSTPAINTGANVKLWWCDDSAGLAKNEHITATWNGAVYANLIRAWKVARSGTITATILSKTPDHDTVSYATDYVDLPSFSYTPTRSKAEVFGMFLLMRSTNTSTANMYAFSGHGGGGTSYSAMRFGNAAAAVPNAFTYDFFMDFGSGSVTHVVSESPDWWYATGDMDAGVIATGSAWIAGQNYSTGPPLAAGGGTNKWKGVFVVGIE